MYFYILILIVLHLFCYARPAKMCRTKNKRKLCTIFFGDRFVPYAATREHCSDNVVNHIANKNVSDNTEACVKISK
jgi:hypothetical protein